MEIMFHNRLTEEGEIIIIDAIITENRALDILTDHFPEFCTITKPKHIVVTSLLLRLTRIEMPVTTAKQSDFASLLNKIWVAETERR